MYTPRYFFSADDHITSTLTQELAGIFNCTVNTTDARTGSKCLQLANGGSATFSLPVAGRIGWIIGFALKAAGTGRFFSWEYGGSGGLSVNAGGAVVFTPNSNPGTGNTLTSAGGIIQPNVWTHIEIFMYPRSYNTTPSSALIVRVNGVTALTAAGGIEFFVNFNNIPSSVFFAGAGVTLIDDVVIGTTDAVTVAAAMPDLQGDLKVVHPALTAGTYAQWAPVGAAANVLAVTDASPDGDTTHVVTSTTGAKDTFQMGALPTNGRVVGVQLAINASTDVSTAQLQGLIRKGSSEAQGSPVGVNVGYAHRSPTVFATNPATGQPWLDSEIPGAEIGYVLV